jgi:TPR repeat protein
MTCEACSNVLTDKNSLRCGGCQTASYCNEDCQRAHWKVHQKTCTASAAAIAAKYSSAALAGDAVAQFNLGLAYGTGVPKDLTEAVRWFRKAAYAGHIDTQANLAVCYHRGTGVKLDLIAAVHWYRRAAEAGHITAQFNLGVCYNKGTGVTKDPLDAVRWTRAAAEAGHAKAQCNLGTCYLDGNGVVQDFTLAKHWLQAAADQGLEDAAQALACLTSCQAVDSGM